MYDFFRFLIAIVTNLFGKYDHICTLGVISSPRAVRTIHQPMHANILDQDIIYLPGVGPHRAKMLGSELGIRTWGDLLHHFPFRYLDRSKIYPIDSITEQTMPLLQVKARVRDLGVIGTGPKARLLAVVYDHSGDMDMVWFQSIGAIQKRLEVGREYIFFGRPTIFNGYPNMVHPEFEAPISAEDHTAVGLQGVYRTTERLSAIGLGTRAIYNCMRAMWDRIGGALPETLPQYLMEQEGLISRIRALHDIHFPSDAEALAAAVRRLKFEELFMIQFQLLSQKRLRTIRSQGYLMPRLGERFNRFFNERLTFALTGAQQRVIREVRGDMVSGHQMNRLVQGDVGSGKTIVALLCSLIAADNGFQSAIMAPTEILATQHYRSIVEQVEGLGFRVELLTGSTRKRERDRIHEGLRGGQIDLLIGTHALIEDTVQFARLGFVVIDEQHRFGVLQRARLRKMAQIPPHVLVMTATPIPRTLAMTLYGDLDVSVIDELPPGRRPIHTSHARESHRLRLFGFMREQIALGRQIYVVYPLIKESEKLDVANLEAGVEVIMREFPPEMGYSSVVVHGKMPAKLKDFGMECFKRGEVQILVSTTVIEVGVNVPNATVMVIESAERFGLSQLHQLRGRVGRGGEQSYCILMTGDKLGTEARRRMEAMVETTDGFRLAELDMQLRGAGQIDGTAQSGQGVEVRLANLATDGELIEHARGVATTILERDPDLTHPSNALLCEALASMNRRDNKTINLAEIS